MKIALLTTRPETASNLRLREAARRLGEVRVVNPWEQKLCLTQERACFDLTLNRVSAVENDPFIFSLMASQRWGRQSNPWEVRQRLWDKSRQALWLHQQGIRALPFFAFRGQLTAADEAWRSFYQRNDRGQGWVLKVNRGMRGVGVHFLKTEGEVLAWCETFYRLGDQDLILQPRLKGGTEWRATFVGGKLWALLERRGADGESPANAAQGGLARELKSAPGDLAPLLEQLTPLAPEFCSIDILADAAGPVVSDVNLVAGFEQLDAITGRELAREYLGHLSQR